MHVEHQHQIKDKRIQMRVSKFPPSHFPFQYAADHVRKQLATHLETKIRVLKYLSKREAPKKDRIKYFLSQVQ